MKLAVVSSRATGAIGVLLLSGALLVAAPARADFLGIGITGEQIETLGWTFALPDGSFDDTTDILQLDATATDITTDLALVHPEIGGGAIDITLSLQSESLIRINPVLPLFAYTAVFTGGNGSGADVHLYSPTGGPNPEQDGRLLVQGNIAGSLTVQVLFDATFATLPSFTANGLFNVTGGDATFLTLFGPLGSSSIVIGTSTNSMPLANVLLADGHLFSVRDVNLASCTVGTNCTGAVLNDSGSFTFGATGEFLPQAASPFVPEPTSVSLLGAGLIGLLAFARRARRSQGTAEHGEA